MLLSLLSMVLFIAFPLALALGSVDLIATKWFARHEYSLRDFPSSVLFDDVARQRLSEATIHYVRSRESTDFLRGLEYEGTAIYIDREVEHLVDVQRVLTAVLLVQRAALALVLVALAAALLVPGLRLTMLKAIYAGCMAIVIAIAGVVLFAAINFNRFFDRFHRVFFESGTWVFYETDSLIQIYPLRFWMDATWKLGVLTLCGAIVFGAVARWLMKCLVGQTV